MWSMSAFCKRCWTLSPVYIEDISYESGTDQYVVRCKQPRCKQPVRLGQVPAWVQNEIRGFRLWQV